jgi:2-haloacid dehalogenase
MLTTRTYRAMRSSVPVKATAAVVFDLFGTLLDVATLRTAVSRYTNDPDALVALWRQKQLAYAFASNSMERYANFDELTLRALRYAAQQHGLQLTEAETAGLAAGWRSMPAFPDALPALQQLHDAGLHNVVLTNATLSTSEDAVRHAGMDNGIEAIHTVDDVRIYKPAPRTYAAVTAHYGRSAEDFVFVTCNGWDAVGAAEVGMRVAWCNRTGAPVETFGKPPLWNYPTLTVVAEAVVAEIAQPH